MDYKDRATLEFLAVQGVATTAQVESLLGLSRGRTAARLRRLGNEELLTVEPIFDGHPRTVVIAPRGLRAVGSSLPPARVNLNEYRHDIGVGWLWLAAQRGRFGEVRTVLSERELRGQDRLSGTHRPDLLLRTATGHGIAIELELTQKSAARLENVMLAYAGDPAIDAVVYIAPEGSIRSRVQEAAQRAGIGEMVHMQRLAPDGIEGATAGQKPSKKSTQRTRLRTTGAER